MTELTTHSLEPWTLAFSPDASRIFSGGDDAVLQALELSSSSVSSGRTSGDHLQDDDNDEENDALSATLLWSDRKLHEAGVTSILPLSNDLLVTGSYDDRIRLLSAPVLGRRKVLAELDLGGGVWRLKVLGVRYVGFTLFFPTFLFRYLCFRVGLTGSFLVSSPLILTFASFPSNEGRRETAQGEQ
jgi:diphthamide biosynthesis protein 7